MSLEQVNQIKEQYKESILAKDHVVGVGTGYKISRGRQTDRLCVVTLVREKIPQSGLSPQSLIPNQLDGVATDVVVVGEIRAQQSPTEVFRPAPGGVSIGHFRTTAGTFGCVVRDREFGTRLILSNNHVLANSNLASPGDPILQPSAVDGGRVKDHTLAYLVRFVPLKFGIEKGTCEVANTLADLTNKVAELFGFNHRMEVIRFDTEAANLVDAAVARPANDEDIRDEILHIGAVDGYLEPHLGQAVRKSGRTTGLTTGTITVLNASVNVNYLDNKIARFENQIITSPMSEGGDSGSLLVDGNELKAVGLLFAGSSQVTIYNPIHAVLDALEVDL